MAEPRKLVLVHNRAPGDVTVLTALVRDIALVHPGRFEIDVDTTAKDLWCHNPYLTNLRSGGKAWRSGIEHIKIQYGRGLRDQNHETVHFLAYFHRDFERRCGIKVPLQLPYPDLHLSSEEKANRIVEGRYWVVINGGKSDFTAKVWEGRKMQGVVDWLRQQGLGVVQAGSNATGHWHMPLRGALNMVGRTSLRDMLRLIYQSDGIVTPVSFAMHAAAALQRPCVVLAGGREAWYWEAYVRQNIGLGGKEVAEKLKMPHRFLHTMGLLDCCRWHGCWRNKTVPLNDDRSLCLHPIMRPGQPVPRCLDMISVTHVTEAIMSYYTDNSLPPISENPQPPAAAPKRKLLDLFDDPAAAPAAPAPTRICTEAHIEGSGKEALPAIACQPGAAPAVLTGNASLFDHPDVGGKFTACVLLYGPKQYFELHQRCLSALLASTPPERLDLRVGSNELNPESLAYVESLVARGLITKHYRHEVNDYKYPVMREMFHDPAHPINTKWVLWFDDDTICDKEPGWLSILAQGIVQHHKRENAHMFGAKFVWTMTNEQRGLIQQRPWYRKRPFRQQSGRPSPSGNKIIFCAGGFWALTAQALRECDIPDVSPAMGLTHNGGDWLIGEQLYQGGFEIKNWNAQKQYVNTSSVPRRGVTMPMPGMKQPLPPKLRVVR